MALKFKYDSKEQVPVEHMPLYAERDGAFVLDVDGVADKSKLDEFRSSNVELIKERDDLKERFKDIDPDEVRKLMAEKRRLEEEQQLKAGEFNKVLENKLNALKEHHGKELTAKSVALEAATKQLTAIQIDQAVVSEATQRGLRATALQDVTARAHSVFQLVNGVPTAYEADGTTQFVIRQRSSFYIKYNSLHNLLSVVAADVNPLTIPPVQYSVFNGLWRNAAPPPSLAPHLHPAI